MKNKSTLSLSCVAVAALLSACGNSQRGLPNGPTPMGYGVNSQASPAYVSPYVERAQAPAPVMPQNSPSHAYQPVQQTAPLAEMQVLRERLKRAERAMLRLDKRMQLLERNELSRISGMEMNGAGTQAPSGMFQPMSYSETSSHLSGSATPLGMNSFQPVEPNAMLQNGHSAYSETQGFSGAALRPVGYNLPNDGMVRASLQAAPAQVQAAQTTTMASRTPRLPSLADDQGSDQDADKSIAVWSIAYEVGKVWPEKAQLAQSRDVIEAIRNSETTTVYARGEKPNSREFRDRVRAVSKYLSKVSNVESVPIASMPADHLGGDVVEIMVVR
jgi:hypothetical protein